jgi:hypothetical protein
MCVSGYTCVRASGAAVSFKCGRVPGSDGGESFSVRWETAELRTLGQAISKLLESQAQSLVFGAAGNAVLGEEQ